MAAANKSSKFVDENGMITEDGKKAYSIKPGQDAKSLVGKMKIGDNTQNVVDAAYNKVYDEEMFKTKGDVKKSATAAHDAVKPFLDENGDALQGQDFWNKQAELSAGVFMGHNSMMLGGGRIFSGAMTPGGKITGTLSSGLSSSENNANISSSGNKETLYNDVINLDNTKTKDNIALKRTGGDKKEAANYTKAFDAASFGLNPKNEIAMGIAEIAHDISKHTGISEDGAAILAASIGGGGAGLAALNKFTKEPIKFDEKQLENFTPVEDDKGKLQGYTDSKGNPVADAKGYATNKHGEKIKRGAVSRAARGVWDKAANLRAKSLPSDESTDSTPNDYNGKDNDSSSDHNKPPVNDLSTDSISKDTPSSKAIQVEIEKVEATPNETAGRDKLRDIVNNKLNSVTKGSKEEGALRKVKAALNGHGSVSAGLLNAGGLDANTLNENDVYLSQNEKGKSAVDFDSTGEFAKGDETMSLEEQKTEAVKREGATKGKAKDFVPPESVFDHNGGGEFKTPPLNPEEALKNATKDFNDPFECKMAFKSGKCFIIHYNNIFG